MQELKIYCDWSSSRSLLAALQVELREGAESARLELRESNHAFRSPGIDPNILVATVGAGGVALGALITGIFRLLEKRGNETAKIVLRSADGISVEAPATASPERLRELIELASRMERPMIRLVGPPDNGDGP